MPAELIKVESLEDTEGLWNIYTVVQQLEEGEQLVYSISLPWGPVQYLSNQHPPFL